MRQVVPARLQFWAVRRRRWLRVERIAVVDKVRAHLTAEESYEDNISALKNQRKGHKARTRLRGIEELNWFVPHPDPLPKGEGIARAVFVRL